MTAGLNNTGVFRHLPVLAEKAPESLVWRTDGLYVDATFGRGGHSRRILSRLSEKGRLIAFDRDLEAVEAAKAISDPRFRIIHAPFSRMEEELLAAGVNPGTVSGVLMDIGVSSPQIDDASRGFSFRFDGPLDMRMDQSGGLSAAEWLAQASETEIARVIADFGEEKFSKRIAKAIVQTREERPILTTSALAKLVAQSVPKMKNDSAQHPATRTFQAIRIHINGELDELKTALQSAGRLLESGGHLSVISFHSLEDRMVKRFFQEAAHPESGLDPRLPLRISELPPALFESVKRIRPDEAECAENPRARSATLRVGVRTAAAWSSAAAGGAR